MKHKDIKTTKFGYHLIFDAYGCDLKVLNSIPICIKILNDIAKIANMKKLMDPCVIKADPNTAVGGKDPGGNSGFLIIQESHISIHTFSKRGFATIDVYSCKEFETEKVISYLKKTLKAKDTDVISFARGLKYPKQNIYK